jgi:integrase
LIQLLSGLKQISTNDAGLIFCDSKGNYIDPDYFDDHIFKPIKEAAGMMGIRFHDLRHFFASMLIAQGESPKYICDQLGHSSIQITFDTYGHLFPQAKVDASEKLEKWMFKGRPKATVSDVLADEGNNDHEKELPEKLN